MSIQDIREKIEEVSKVETFKDLGKLHATLVLELIKISPAQVAREQAFYNSTIIAKAIGLLSEKLDNS